MPWPRPWWRPCSLWTLRGQAFNCTFLSSKCPPEWSFETLVQSSLILASPLHPRAACPPVSSSHRMGLFLPCHWRSAGITHLYHQIGLFTWLPNIELRSSGLYGLVFLSMFFKIILLSTISNLTLFLFYSYHSITYNIAYLLIINGSFIYLNVRFRKVAISVFSF